MASSSSSLNWKYDVFLSFRGKDVRVTFLSHFLKELDRKLITAFKGKEIERSHSLWPYLVQAIRSSRIAVVIFSKNYASSSWCLNELLEIVNCKDNIVIPVFYGLDPSHVRNQTGDFGRIFQETCKKNTEQKQNQWKKALNDVANTLGFHSATWDDEAKMIEAIANDVLGKLLLTSSEDSDDLVGIEAHIAEMSLLLQLESEEVRMVGIWGSSGIGKTTIASALFNRLSRHFQGSIFIDRVFISKSKKDYSRRNPDDPNMKLHLQGHFLSEILGKKDIKIDHLGALGERLKHQKVLIIIDDLDDQEVLDTLVGQTQWFGYGSRIIVVTNDKHFLRAHGIDHIYEVSFPSEERAQEMLCRSAFKQNYPPEGFGKLVADVVRYAGNLPLGLNVLGSYLRDRDEVYWMHLLQSVLDGKIGNTLRVSYDGLDREEDKIIFLHIACLFNYVEVKDIKQLLADSNLGVSIGLTHLVDKSLIHIRGDHVVMHRLLQEMGRKIVRTQTIDKPGEREFLVDPNDISYVLSEGIGTQKILGISLDTSEIAFKGMRNLRFLRVYKNFRKEGKLHFSESFVYLPPKLNLLYWPKYPMSCMPSNFRPENLVKLKMQNSKLHKLWEGVVPLTSLKKMDLQGSTRLEDIPNLSMATNLEKLRLVACMSLVELPSSIRNLNKLLNLDMSSCKSLAILPTGFNLKSLEHLNLNYCSELRTFPEISTNISDLRLFNTNIEEFPSNLHLENLVRVTISKKKRDGKQWEGVEQNFLIKLLMTDNKTRAKALKNAVQFSGVIAVEIQEVFRNQMVVTGDGIDIVGLIMTLRKKVAFAELVSVNKDEPFKDGFKLPIKKYVFRSYLKRVGGERDRILWDKKSDRNLIQKKKSDRNLKEAKIVQAEAKSRRVVPVIEEKDFVGHLVKVLKNNGVNVDEFPSGDIHFKGIEESRMALVIFSSRYAESRGCLNELVKIKELMEERKLLVIPIFYNVEPLEVTQLKGDFGVKFWNSWRISRDHHIIEWKEALKSVASIKGIYLKEHCSESEFITLTVNKVVDDLSTQNGENPSLFISTGKGKSTDFSKHPLFGMEQRMEQLEKKLEFDCNETLIIGVVGMPGIGKTTLAMMLHEKWNCKFLRCVPFLGIRKKSEIYKKSEEYGLVWLRKTLLEVLLEGKFPAISDKTTHESVKNKLLQKKVFVVLDDVSNKKQLDFLLSDLTWIKKGSKIIITTSDQSLLKGLADDTFVVPLLNDKEAFQLFTFHAFDDQICSATRNFLSLSRKFVDYARGHPQALILLGIELHGKDEAHWEHRLGIITDRHYTWIQDIWRLSTDQLNEQQQRDVFLDIVYFFKSEDEYFVRSLLDSGDPDSTDSMSEVRDLADKFLITISDGRVEMHNLLYRFSKGLGSPLQYRLWNYEDIINKLKKMELSDAHNVRGIFLDMSKLTKSFTLDSSTFMDMRNLRYLKIYDSCCPRQCIADCKLHFPEGLEFPLEEVRYLHWLKFPLKELPKDFRPDNLVDLRLPHSNVERVWEGVKDTPRLKWVDLSHSSNLLDLSALSRAENLQRLNLEGCTILDKLPMEIQYMKSLVFLNLRGCTHLSYLPEMNLVSLKTLILSDCSNLEKFQLISESLEVLHLDGTAIKALPLAIKKLQRLVLLNLKNCEMLECLPKCLGELKALEEIILSGCSRLKNLSDIKENMKHLQSLFIDWIGAKEMPHISCATISEGQASADMVIQPFGPREWPRGVNGVCSLQRLCLSGNDFVSLQTDIGKLFNLNWLDVRQCKLLTSIPMLPPKLRYFDAHGCDSLERVANPLALPVLSDKIHATFNFFNCNKLDQDAKDSIIAYTRRKSELVLDALSRYNGGSVLEDFTGSCFPGCEVPAWFSHQASGSLLKQRLPQHWCDNRFTGIALCAVILFPGYYKQRNRLFVKCKCVFNNEDESRINFSCTIGSWRKPSNTPGKIEPSHVFIGYTSTLDIKNYGEEEDEEGCSQTEASFKFQVTDGTDVLEGCKVLKCGFSLVYAIDERENIRWDPETVVIPERIENIRGIAISYEESGSRDDIHYKSYSGLCPGRDEGFFCETKSDANPILQKSLENMEVDLLNEEEDAGREFIKMRDDWTLSIGQLNERQRDVFLDIVHFFKSEDENFVKSILDSGNPEAVSEVRDLADKFLITISGGRVEMHDQLYTLAKDLGSPGQHRLCNDKDIINKMTKMKQPEANNVRGIFLDMSEIRESIALECMTFADMRNLLYLKIYDSYCPRKCNADCNLHFPDGLEFPLEEVRYLHWVKFPLQELPPDFRPENLVDLRLPYSKIERVWEDVKDTPRLKWVDLRHSVKLLDLSALSKAENLQRLNLEGCTSLDELPLEIQNMKSLVFLNLRGCIRLCYLPKMNLISLKTLILSDCSSLKEFQLISESVEFLHLDGTAIEGLPAAIQNLRRLVVLNLKNCKMLECLPNCLGKLKFLDELVLSGCSRLKSLPVVRHSLKHLQILLLDGTRANEMPSISYFTGSEGPASADISLQPSGSYSTVREYACGVNGVSSLRRLCLSGNDFVTLQPDIGKLYNLNWLDVKQCKKLIFVPTLPPRLQYFNAHGCDSLERVANPLALPVLSEQNHASFNFSNCNKLDQDAKDSIISYTRWRSQLMLDELTRYDEGFVLEAFTGTCFPGWEVPAWFSHRAFGLVLKPKLPLHFSDNMFTGIALCAVISFDGYHEQRNRLLVKCKGVFNNEDESRISFSCTIGSWSKSNNTPGKIETSHVFIGYISMLDIKKLGEEDKERCNHTEALFEFQVTDGTEVFKGCEVLKCGFSLVYATNELRVKSGVCESHLDANQYRAYSKNVAISDVRRETEAAERSPDGGDKVLELPNKMIALEIATSPQPPIPKSHVSPVEYGSGSNNSGRERDIRMFDVDARLSGDPQHHSDNLIHMVASSSEAGNRQSHSQVFVSYHGVELHRTFIRHLVSTLTDAGVSVFTDNDKGNGIKKPMQLYQRIEESKIALAIFSKRYVESSIFLDELVLMDKLAKEGKLLVIPVFYNVRSSDVRNFTGEFGLRFKEMREIYKDKLEKVPKWETSIRSIAETIISIDSEVHGDDAHLVEATVGAVQTALTKIS